LKKPDPVEQALDRLAALKNAAGDPAVAAELTGFLKNRSNLVVAKAAKIAGQARARELVPELVGAFHRLMKDPAKLDKTCAATTEIAGALYEMDYAEPEIYLLGIHHVQMEGSFGPPVDAAAKLRAISALGLARTRHPAALDEIVSLLVDEWPEARIGAVRAMAVNGGPAGALLLKLKILRKTVLLAIAMIRSDAAIEFLLALLEECTPVMAKDVIAALAFFRSNEKVRSRVESVVARRNEKSVSESFRQEF
jgi:hypothetical protein